ELTTYFEMRPDCDSPQSDSFAWHDGCQSRRARLGHDAEFQDRTPVTSGSSTQPFLENRVRQLGASNSVGVENVGVLALCPHNFRPSDVAFQRHHIRDVRLALQEHHDEMLWVPLGFFTKRVLA